MTRQVNRTARAFTNAFMLPPDPPIERNMIVHKLCCRRRSLRNVPQAPAHCCIDLAQLESPKTPRRSMIHISGDGYETFKPWHGGGGGAFAGDAGRRADC